MTTNICTSIEQSKRLLELGLKPDTADMYWHTFPVGDKEITALTVKEHPFGKGDIPAWSLTALLDMMPITIGGVTKRILTDDYFISEDKRKWECFYARHVYVSVADTPLDSVFGQVCWLIKNNYIETK